MRLLILSTICLLSSTLSADVIVTSEDFEGGASGWTNNTTTVQPAPFTEFLGRFDGSQSVSKTFSLSGSQTEVTIQFDFFQIDSWDGEKFSIYVDDVLLQSDIYTHGAAYSPPNSTDLFTLPATRGTRDRPPVIKEIRKRPAANDSGQGGGADVEFIENDGEALLRITTPNDRIIVREVGKKNSVAGPGDDNPGADNVTFTTGTVAVDQRDRTVSVELEGGEPFVPRNGAGLLNSGQIEAGDEVDVVVVTDPGNDEIMTGTVKVKGTK